MGQRPDFRRVLGDEASELFFSRFVVHTVWKRSVSAHSSRIVISARLDENVCAPSMRQAVINISAGKMNPNFRTYDSIYTPSIIIASINSRHSAKTTGSS